MDAIYPPGYSCLVKGGGDQASAAIFENLAVLSIFTFISAPTLTPSR